MEQKIEFQFQPLLPTSWKVQFRSQREVYSFCDHGCNKYFKALNESIESVADQVIHMTVIPGVSHSTVSVGRRNDTVNCYR